jgi:gliding motility-associated-like protein
MKKIAILFILCCSLSQLVFAQCPTCKGGRRDTADKIKPKNGSSTLGQSYIQQNVCGLAYVAGSVFTATRYTPTSGPAPTGFPTTIAIAGLPTNCLTILKAFVYYGASYTEGSAPNTSVNITNPSAGSGTYAATTTGTAPSVCWGETGTAGYRADVTPTITGNGNYTINLTGFANAAYEVDGVTLIIIYTSPQTWTGSIVLYDGCMSTSGGSMTYTGTGFNVCNATGTADAFGCMGDMQNNVSATNDDTYNGSNGTFNNNFWNFNDVPTTLAAAQTSCVYDGYTNDGGDCWLWCLAGLYWQNSGCTTCTTTTSTLTVTTTQVNPTCSGTGNATVTVGGGTAPYTYLWSNGQTSSTATGLGVGSYTVTIKDAACGTGIDSVTLTNPTAPTITPSTTAITCFGTNNGAASVNVTGGTPGYTYAWTPVGGTNANASNLSAGTYTCTVTDASGCTQKDSMIVTEPTQLRDSITAFTNATCLVPGNATVGVKGGTGTYTYNWLPSGGTGTTGTALSAGTYTVHVTDKNGCMDSATVTITNPGAPTATTTTTNVVCFGGKSGSATITPAGGTAPYTYSWSPSGGAGPTATNLSAGTYSCTVTDKNGCNVTSVVTITQAPAIRDSVISITNASCFGLSDGSIAVGTKGGAAPLGYSWSPSGGTAATGINLSAGTYKLTITDANGCVATISGTVTQPTQVTSTAAASPTAICSGQTSTLSGNAAGGTGPYTYVWDATASSQNYTVSPNVTTVYTVVATDNNGCSAAPATVTVNVNPSPNIAFTPNVTQGCYPLCISFTDGSTPVGTIKSWYWQFGNGDTSTMQNPMDCYTSPGEYSVTLTDVSTFGCTSTLTMPNLISAYDHPHAAFAATPQPADILQPQIQFTDKTVDYYGLQSWFWTFGDVSDSTSSLQNPSHTYGDTGTFCPTLVVTNIHQCTDSVEQCIVIDPHFTLYIPNAFTPNGNVRNDIFLPTGIYICTFEMWIFDRWGMQIFHTKDINQGWNGTVNSSSNLAQQDTYVYVIDATDCLKHTNHHYLGSVTLIK